MTITVHNSKPYEDSLDVFIELEVKPRFTGSEFEQWRGCPKNWRCLDTRLTWKRKRLLNREYKRLMEERDG